MRRRRSRLPTDAVTLIADLIEAEAVPSRVAYPGEEPSVDDPTEVACYVIGSGDDDETLDALDEEMASRLWEREYAADSLLRVYHR